MNSIRTQSLVLKRTNYGEADRIVQVITPEGKKSLMVKGARREKSKLASGVELLTFSDITVHEGRGELGVLTSARIVKFYGKILQDHDSLKFVYEALKLVARSSEHVDSPEFFMVLNSTLEALESGADLDLVRTWFYIRYARVLGDELNLATDADGHKLELGASYAYDIEDQVFRQSECGDVMADHIKLLRVMTHNDIKTVRKVSGTEPLLSVCLHLARIVAKL
ncbi:MAG: DNA repair protein RecO [Candidatus Nomurabacteria bacterium]|jgi:DNA repair protein RecO (recombination protein O)|nr:DNA repair protein RecO [Candidatus Nomurabacteria bacterium]